MINTLFKPFKRDLREIVKFSNVAIKQNHRAFVALASAKQSTSVLPQSLEMSMKLNVLRNSQRGEFDFYLPKSGKRQRYEFDEENHLIGQGFFAKVFKAVDVVTDSNVALKIIEKSKCPKEVYNQELRIFEQLETLKPSEKQGLGLCRDVRESEQEVTMVFDLYRGDLFDEVVDHGVLDEVEIRSLMFRLLTSLKNLHSNNFVHRDVKLENILLPVNSESREQALKESALTDFGYAKKLGEKDKFRNPAGTFGYVAPEVLSDRKYSPACDVWSAGTVFFTCIAGFQPFPYKKQAESSSSESQSSSDQLVEHELEAIEHGMSDLVWKKEMAKPAFAKCSDELKDLLRQMLEMDPKKRISAEEALCHPWFYCEEERSLAI